MLKIDNSLSGSRYFADERQTYLAVSANFLRLIRGGLVGIGSLDHISGREPHRRSRTRRIRQRRNGGLAATARQRGTTRKSANGESGSRIANGTRYRL